MTIQQKLQDQVEKSLMNGRPRYRCIGKTLPAFTGTVRWETNSIFGLFTADNGQQFSVTRDEVERL